MPRTQPTATNHFSLAANGSNKQSGMISDGRAKGIEFVLPIDFVLQDSRISETIGPDDQQFDVSRPSTSSIAKSASS